MPVIGQRNRNSDPGSSPPLLRRSLRTKLLRWYDANRRDLPWRRTNDPYAKWVAEIMLQQTQVKTVIPYYQRFLDRFPDVGALARARHDVVLKHWEGLGYYRRALHLHRAAAIVCENGGTIPTTIDGLRELPGVGGYVASAIASMVFGRRAAAVDGNVSRVIARLFALPLDVRTAEGKRQVDAHARELLSVRRPGDFNEAWMDLGSLICTPKKPACDACPLRRLCAAADSGSPENWPVRTRQRRSVPMVSTVVSVITHRGRLLVRRRPRGGLWSGLWEFPNESAADSRVDARAARRIARNEGIDLTGVPTKVDVIAHQLTHRSLRLHVYVCVAKSTSGTDGSSSRRWAGSRSLRRLSMSTAHRRVLKASQSAIDLR